MAVFKKIEVINLTGDGDVPEYHVEVSASENARIKREIRTTYKIIYDTATRLVAEGDFKGFGFSPQIIGAIVKSGKAREPFVVGRFDARYEPGKPTQFYELNTLLAGGFREKLGEEIDTHDIDYGRSESVFEEGLKSAWESVAKYTKRRNISRVGYIEVAPSDEDFSFLRMEAITITKFFAPHQIIENVQVICLPNDPYGIRTYLDNAPKRRLLLPSAFNMLLDNKAIWAHAYRLYPGHPNLIPTSFDPMDFINPRGWLHEHWKKSRRILAKPVYECQGKGQMLIKSAKQALEYQARGMASVYSAWTPEWYDEHQKQVRMHGYIINNGKTAAYTFGEASHKNGNHYYDLMPHYVPRLSGRKQSPGLLVTL